MTIDVAIVGAGAAGVGAARRLAGSGLSGLLVEADDRIGGRAWTQGIDGLPLDLGCGWLHSGERNRWTGIAETAGFTVDRRAPAWGMQWHGLGFPDADRTSADRAYGDWRSRLDATPPRSDRTSDALDPGGRWNALLDARSGWVSGTPLDRLSVADYLAYERAASDANWRVVEGYGRLVAASLPVMPLRLGMPVTAIRFARDGVRLVTHGG